MLYNTSITNPGKFTIKKNINKIWDACNTELFMRYLLHECDTNLKTKKDILDYINEQRKAYDKDILNEPISILFTNLDPRFEKVTVNNLMDACFDRLGIVNKRIITDKFILSLGIWLTDEENVELTENDLNGEPKNKLQVIVERLCLNPDTRLRISPTGLSFSEFRSFVQLSPLPKISSLSTIALRTLTDKILLLLDNDLNYHIDKWTSLMSNITRVAEARNIALPTFEGEK